MPFIQPTLNTNSKKIRIETYKQQIDRDMELNFKYQFQENKDWNIEIEKVQRGANNL